MIPEYMYVETLGSTCTGGGDNSTACRPDPFVVCLDGNTHPMH